jgi:hypothetical protein
MYVELGTMFAAIVGTVSGRRAHQIGDAPKDSPGMRQTHLRLVRRRRHHQRRPEMGEGVLRTHADGDSTNARLLTRNVPHAHAHAHETGATVRPLVIDAVATAGAQITRRRIDEPRRALLRRLPRLCRSRSSSRKTEALRPVDVRAYLLVEAPQRRDGQW